MATLQSTIESAIAPYMEETTAKRHILRMVLSKKDIHLSDEEIDRLVAAVEAGETYHSTQGSSEGGSREITIDDADMERAMKVYCTLIRKATAESLADIVNSAAPPIVTRLRRRRSKGIKDLRHDQAMLEECLMGIWGDAIGRLEFLIAVAREVSDEAFAKRQESSLHLKRPKLEAKWQAIYSLQRRGCRTALEVVSLLKAGLADGAMARWRSLHELAITAMFLNEHRNSVSRRYLDHSEIERFKSFTCYQRHCRVLGYPQSSAADIDAMEEVKEKLIRKYGRSFIKGNYGWAAAAVHPDNATFESIEKHIDAEHWRPFYKLACDSVHAGARAGQFSIGGYDGSVESESTLAGLYDPGRNCALSLAMATVSLLTISPTADYLVHCEVLTALANDVESAFAKGERSLESGLVVMSDDEVAQLGIDAE